MPEYFEMFTSPKGSQCFFVPVNQLDELLERLGASGIGVGYSRCLDNDAIVYLAQNVDQQSVEQTATILDEMRPRE